MTTKMVGAITEEDAAFTEEWESVSPASQWVITLDFRGDEDPQEVKQGERFYITTRDRMLTEHKIRDKDHNPFRNGAFRPITVPENVTVQTNPNAMSDEHILSVFQGSDLAWDEAMKVVDSPATIQRMLTLADQGAEISHRRFKQLQERLVELHPRARLATNDEQLSEFLYGKKGRSGGVDPVDDRGRGGGVENIGMKPKNRPGGGFTRS